MFDSIVAYCHLVSLCLIVAFWALEGRLVGVWNVLCQPGSVMTVTEMVVQGVLVQEKLGANFTVMGDLVHLGAKVATHLFSDRGSHDPMGETKVLEQGIAISTNKRTPGAFKPMSWQRKGLQDGVAEMVDLVISLIPRLVRVRKLLTTEFTYILGNFCIVKPLKAGQCSDVCGRGILQRLQRLGLGRRWSWSNGSNWWWGQVCHWVGSLVRGSCHLRQSLSSHSLRIVVVSLALGVLHQLLVLSNLHVVQLQLLLVLHLRLMVSLNQLFMLPLGM